MFDREFNESAIEKNKMYFMNELKIIINQKLFDKKLISENMYQGAKELFEKIS